MATSRIRSGAVAVEGLSQLNRALRELESGLPKAARAGSKEIAQDVADQARGLAQSLGGVAAHVAPSIKASAGAKSAGVAFGGPAWPMAGGAEFGALNYPQFQPWRGNSNGAGYFVYPTIRDMADEITDRYLEHFDDLKRRAGL